LLGVNAVKTFASPLSVLRRRSDRTGTASPSALSRGDSLQLGPLTAILEALLGHPRLVTLRFAGAPHSVWAGIARHGRPIQYAHIPMPLALWDVWTPIATAPVAFEPPSASFVLDWKSLEGEPRRRDAHPTAGFLDGDPALTRAAAR
jgi:S-adenosylmethionine:tRNA ribosyltransferase-isomerase